MSDLEMKNLKSQFDREIKYLQNKLERLVKKTWNDGTTNFIWLMILSNLLFWLFISNLELSYDFKKSRLASQHE